MLQLLVLILSLQYECMKTMSYSHERLLPNTQTSQNSSQMVVSLPQGFYPPIPPIKPMLYPFRKEHLTTTEANAYYSDWQPIVPQASLQPSGTVRHYVPYDRNIEDTNYHSNHRYDAVMFGPWQPVSPLLTEHLPHVYYNGQENFEQSAVTPAQDRNYVRIGNKKTLNEAKRQNVLNDSKITMVNKTINLKVLNETSSEVEAPETLSQATTSSNVWPKDFHSAVEATKQPEQENADTLLDAPVNITRMGIPFENTNSTDKSSICVPVTVQAQKSTTEVMEYERVYCFPLPTKANQTNVDTILNKSIDTENTLDTTTLNAAEVINTHNILLKLCYLINVSIIWLVL